MISNRRNSFLSKGDDYSFSHLKPIDKKLGRFPWVCTYFSDKFNDISLIKCVRYLYHKEAPFFTLIVWTIVTGTVFIVVALPDYTLIINALLFIIPAFICFFVYLWAGLFLKYYMLSFSLGICLIGCLILEVIIELPTLNAVSDISRPLGTISFLLSFIVMTIGICVMKDSHYTTWILMSTFIISRFTIMDGVKMFHLRVALPPLLTYVCILGGLAVSNLTNLKIPHINADDMEYKNCTSDMDSIPVIRQRRASSVEIPVLNQNGVNTASVKTRRKSLPVLGLPSRKFSMSSMDLTILGEAHGMITDLLADSSLPVNVTGTLRIVADMISPLLQHSFSKHPFSTALLTVIEKSQFQEDEQQVMNQPDLKDDTPLSLRQRLQRNLGVTSRRMSSSYTTTTSATGMPTIDMEYHSKKKESPLLGKPEMPKRSANRSKSYAGILSDRKIFAINKSLSFSQVPNSMKRDAKVHNEDQVFKAELTRDKTIQFDNMETGGEGVDGKENKVEENNGHSYQSYDLNILKSAESPDTKGRTNLHSVSEHGEHVEDKECILDELPTDCTNTSKANTYQVNSTSSENEQLFQPVGTSDYSRNNSSVEISNKKHSDAISLDSQNSKSQNINSQNTNSQNTNSQNTNLQTNNTQNTNSQNNNSQNTNLQNIILQNNNSQNNNSQNNNSQNTNSQNTISQNTNSQNTNCQNTSSHIPAVNSVIKGKNESKDVGNLPVPVTHGKRRSSRELHMEYEIAISKDIDRILNKIVDWDFPIFELSEKCNVLTQLAFRIFTKCDFFKKFKIPETTFLKYFRALESGYHDIPYHNRIHAADVLHGVFYLTQHTIPGFSETLSRRSSVNANDIPEEASMVEEYTSGCMVDCMPDLELMALYTAAAMHDFDHPGVTNAFLVATLNPKALLYNDRSVLESHHAAASWSLLISNPGLNFLSDLDPVDFKRFRFIVIEEILSTDLKKHFDFLTEWNAKVSDQGGGLNFTCESDRLLVGQMTIKLADISGPSKEWSLHYRWTDRIIEEFYQQGESERNLGIPLSAYMDRVNPKVPQLQASFIKHLVSPLYSAFEKAHTMPGEWVDAETDDDEELEMETSANNSDGESSESDKVVMRKKKVPYSLISDNINKNYKKWLDIIEETEKNNSDKLPENEDEDEKLNDKLNENENDVESP